MSDKEGYTFTHTVEFELEGGRRLQIPGPDPERYRRFTSHQCSTWPPEHLGKIYFNNFKDETENYDIFSINCALNVNHEAGRCWLHDFAQLLRESQARIVSWISWRRRGDPVRPLDSDSNYPADKPRRETY